MTNMHIQVAALSAERDRIRELDALRGIAALMVVLYHYTTRYQQFYGHSSKLAFSFPLGLYGVHLFFIISGFVIFMTANRSRRLADFVVSRFARLYPAFWAAVPLTFCVIMLSPLDNQKVAVWQAAVNLTMLEEFIGVPFVDGVYWTLTNELIFYAIMAATLFSPLRRHLFSVCVAWLSWTIVLLAAKPILGSTSWEIVAHWTVYHYAHLFVAGICFYAIRTAPDRRRWVWLLIACAALSLGHEHLPANILVASFVTVFGLAVAGRLPWLGAPILVFIGEISYPLYLVHQNVGYVAIERIERAGYSPYWAIAAAITISFGLAVILNRSIERPGRSLIRTIFRSSKRGSPVEALSSAS